MNSLFFPPHTCSSAATQEFGWEAQKILRSIFFFLHLIFSSLLNLINSVHSNHFLLPPSHSTTLAQNATISHPNCSNSLLIGLSASSLTAHMVVTQYPFIMQRRYCYLLTQNPLMCSITCRAKCQLRVYSVCTMWFLRP